MKKLLLGALLLLSIVSFCQTTEIKTIFKSDFGYEISNSITKQGITTYFYWGYQNQEYKHITDIGSIFITKKVNLKLFADKLSEFSKKERGVNISFNNAKFSILLYDFSEMIYVEDNRGKYMTLSKNSAKKLADEIYTKLNLLKY